jgi:hypothetical protein
MSDVITAQGLSSRWSVRSGLSGVGSKDVPQAYYTPDRRSFAPMPAERLRLCHAGRVARLHRVLAVPLLLLQLQALFPLLLLLLWREQPAVHLLCPALLPCFWK